MNNLDIALIVIIALSTLVGFARGGLSSILSTIGWIIALIGNHYLFNNIEPFLEERFDSKILTFIVGYVGGLFIILFLVSIINFLILSMLAQFRGGMIDKTIGIIFGAIRGVLIVTIVFLCFESGMRALSGEDGSVKDYPQILLDGATLPIMKKVEIQLIASLPDSFKENIFLQSITQDKVSDIKILNIVRKLSEGIPKDTVDKINSSIEQNSNYKTQRQILIAKVEALIEFREKNGMKSLSDEDLKTIESIIKLDVRKKS